MRITTNIHCFESAQETGGPASSKLNLICASCLTPPCPAMLRQRVDAVQYDGDNPKEEDDECYAGENYCLGESGLQDAGDTSGVMKIDETLARTTTLVKADDGDGKKMIVGGSAER